MQLRILERTGNQELHHIANLLIQKDGSIYIVFPHFPLPTDHGFIVKKENIVGGVESHTFKLKEHSHYLEETPKISIHASGQIHLRSENNSVLWDMRAKYKNQFIHGSHLFTIMCYGLEKYGTPKNLKENSETKNLTFNRANPASTFKLVAFVYEPEKVLSSELVMNDGQKKKIDARSLIPSREGLSNVILTKTPRNEVGFAVAVRPKDKAIKPYILEILFREWGEVKIQEGAPEYGIFTITGFNQLSKHDGSLSSEFLVAAAPYRIPSVDKISNRIYWWFQKNTQRLLSLVPRK